MGQERLHWYEGMFLRPHHFQAGQRGQAALAKRGDQFLRPYGWGLRSVRFDRDALANGRLIVRELQARLRDGTTIVVPDDATLPEVDLKPAMERTGSVTVHLGLPVYRPGRPNVSDDPLNANARYLSESSEIEDENSGTNPQRLRMRRLNLRLLTAEAELAGHDAVPIVRVTRSMASDGAPTIDESYIPPLLCCDAWAPLREGILGALYYRIGKKMELLAEQVAARRITFDSHAQGDPSIREQLRELNEAHPVLGVFSTAQGVHPFDAYVELARLVGRLALFSERRTTPELPTYDHDDLGTRFFRLKAHVDEFLSTMVEPDYKERTFVGTGLRMQVVLEPHWLESVWSMYIGVRSPLDPAECIRMLTRPGELDMKVGGSERVDTIYRMGDVGLQFLYSPQTPRSLPSVPGLIYFQINREASVSEWQHVSKSLTLAIRLNENLIAGKVQGQTTLTIRTRDRAGASGPPSTTMQFTLYIVPREN